MKKLLTLLMAIVLAGASLSARDKVYRTTDVLPEAAKKTLATSFGKVGVNHVKVDKHTFGGTDYEVILNDGSEVEFNSDGAWKSVDCGQKAVPSEFVLKAISKYVNDNFKGARIVKVEQNRHDYEIDLSTGKELKFDRAGKFLRVDD